jgi:EAL domain-containing protein (putative c-di-GMP-specific phosphodiesterase class I)
MGSWYLEGYVDGGDYLRQLPLRQFPQLIGRDDTLDCCLASDSVSRRHAQFESRAGDLYVKDLGSSNGTFVNRRRIEEPTLLQHGDVLHLGTVELRIIDRMHALAHLVPQLARSDTTVMNTEALSDIFPSGVGELEQLLASAQVQPVFQPIVSRQRTRFGYEILGRGDCPGLPSSPLDLFRIAESAGLDIRLSELFRNRGVDIAVAHHVPGYLLVNTHPRELNHPDQLIQSLRNLRKRAPSAALMLEIHEASVTDVALLIELKRALMAIDIKLAFDDFGVGQSRLMEMVEAKPSLIKFDRALILDIENAGYSRQSLLQSMRDLTRTLGIPSLAECVSKQGEYDVCQTMDFDFYQGYFFGEPRQVSQLAA